MKKMGKMRKFFVVVILAVCTCMNADAQSWLKRGSLSGSFESNSIYYAKDVKIDPLWNPNEDIFASNNYLKLDYNLGKFSAGIQLEAYMPALKGYDLRNIVDYKKFFVGSKYVQWQDHDFSIRVGNLYEQFGSGIIFRSYEDRTLGINNSLEGVAAKYNYNNIVAVTAVAGRPRFGSKYLESWVRGADLSFVLSELFNDDNLFFSLEGSYVNRYESLDKDPSIKFEEYFGVTSPNLNIYSGRLNLGYGGVTFKGEYVRKQNADIPHTSIIGKGEKGEAFLAEIGVNIDRFAMLATFRKLSYMGTALSVYEGGMLNNLNYLPILTRQYTYSLANLNPYKIFDNGDIGGQVDFYYSLNDDRGKYWNFHANFSTFYTNKIENTKFKRAFLWRDMNFDVERQWSGNFKTTLLYSNQKWDPMYGMVDSKCYTSNIFVVDLVNRFDRRTALRTELQYLQSKDYEKDWVSGLFELSLAPKWSFFVGDMYNFDSKKHYYNGGLSFSKGRSRAQLSYGRNRAGYICSGGVCRATPAFTGLNLVLTTSF